MPPECPSGFDLRDVLPGVTGEQVRGPHLFDAVRTSRLGIGDSRCVVAEDLKGRFDRYFG